MNYYDILGIRKNASSEDIKKAYKNLIKKYHPDVYKGDKTFAEKKTTEIIEAYDVLSNPNSKQAYDEEIAPKNTYAYTPPQYTNTYDNYNNNYTNSYTNRYQNATRDGSEHDYSTYVNYNHHYTDYHRSKTPNSSYTYDNDPFTSKIVEKFDTLNTKTKQRLIIGVIILCFVLLIYFILQLHIFLHPNTSNHYTNSGNITIQKPSITNEEPENKINTNSTIPNSTVSNINLYDYFTEDELQLLYKQFLAYTDYQITYEQFLNILSDYINSLHQTH